jgi:hypothetical protein
MPPGSVTPSSSEGAHEPLEQARLHDLHDPRVGQTNDEEG